MDKSGTFVRNHSKGYLNPIGAKAITWPQIKNALVAELFRLWCTEQC